MRRDIIVVGASAGGIEALGGLLGELPGDLNASVFAVLHQKPTARSMLPSVLSGKSRIPVTHAVDLETIERGRVYLAPPDFHMMVENDRIRLWRGPKESYHRPSINVLFRSAAVTFGERVAGVVLSGMLDDGSAGLWWIKHYGGLALVQDPCTAAFPNMPATAMRYIVPDFVLDPAKIGKQVAKLTNSTGKG